MQFYQMKIEDVNMINLVMQHLMVPVVEMVVLVALMPLDLTLVIYLIVSSETALVLEIREIEVQEVTIN